MKSFENIKQLMYSSCYTMFATPFYWFILGIATLLFGEIFYLEFSFSTRMSRYIFLFCQFLVGLFVNIVVCKDVLSIFHKTKIHSSLLQYVRAFIWPIVLYLAFYCMVFVATILVVLPTLLTSPLPQLKTYSVSTLMMALPLLLTFLLVNYPLAIVTLIFAWFYYYFHNSLLLGNLLKTTLIVGLSTVIEYYNIRYTWFTLPALLSKKTSCINALRESSSLFKPFKGLAICLTIFYVSTGCITALLKKVLPNLIGIVTRGFLSSFVVVLMSIFQSRLYCHLIKEREKD